MMEILEHHTIKGKLTLKDLQKMNKLETLKGDHIVVDRSDGARIDGAKILQPDIEAESGMIHVIDRVLLPET
jgi:uncharacterized surface protein with fasciclin (FAS1) repeats